MNALLVDDERLARAELRRLLSVHPDVTVVGEAENPGEAEARLDELPVDLLFLDIKMPGGTGFDLLERLDRVPLLVFTTAYDEFALRAFEVNACDYLLKPIHPDRLAVALDKMRLLWSAARVTTPPSSAPASTPGPRLRAAADRVFLRDGDRCWIVTMGEIACFEGEGNYARVHFGANRPLLRTSLNALEARIDPALFFRASRKHLINLRFIERIEAGIDEAYTVTLRGGQSIEVSRRQSCRLRDSLGL
jgi:two-component system LytT family response regulator